MSFDIHAQSRLRPSRPESLFVLSFIFLLLPGCGLGSPVLRSGGSPYQGRLLNLSCGARAWDPADPGKPTVVLTHGWNPLPKLIRTTLGEAGAGSIHRRFGDDVNVFSWDWNAVRISALKDDPAEISKLQGIQLARALHLRGVSADQTHMIGHSLGAIVVSRASRTLCHLQGKRTRQVTLLDPPSMFHELIFDELCPTKHAERVENYWAPGVSGYGAAVARAGVCNYSVRGDHPIIGIVDLSVSNHVETMAWYAETMNSPQMNCGFQRSFIASMPK